MGKILYKTAFLMVLIGIFMLGWLSSSVANNVDLENPLSLSVKKANELNSPSNRIKEEQIHVYNDKVVIDIPEVQWAKFTDTNSMDPVLDIEANSFEVVPQNPKDIKVGDIISYRPANFAGLVVHRVVETGNDKEGWYAIAKGDNISSVDPDKVRFEQVSGVLVGIFY